MYFRYIILEFGGRTVRTVKRNETSLYVCVCVCPTAFQTLISCRGEDSDFRQDPRNEENNKNKVRWSGCGRGKGVAFSWEGEFCIHKFTDTLRTLIRKWRVEVGMPATIEEGDDAHQRRLWLQVKLGNDQEGWLELIFDDKLKLKSF